MFWEALAIISIHKKDREEEMHVPTVKWRVSFFKHELWCDLLVFTDRKAHSMHGFSVYTHTEMHMIDTFLKYCASPLD